MRPLITDPKTGYVGFNGPTTLKPEQKALLIKYLETKPFCIMDACDTVGISEDSLYRHIQIDPVFARDLGRVKSRKIQEIEQKLAERAVEDQGVADRIFFLKCHKPEIYNPGSNINVNHNFNLLEKLSSEAKGYLDAEVVSPSANKELAMADNTANLPETSETH